jgi:hypothetical protein
MGKGFLCLHTSKTVKTEWKSKNNKKGCSMALFLLNASYKRAFYWVNDTLCGAGGECKNSPIQVEMVSGCSVILRYRFAGTLECL